MQTYSNNPLANLCKSVNSIESGVLLEARAYQKMLERSPQLLPYTVAKNISLRVTALERITTLIQLLREACRMPAVKGQQIV